MSTSYDLICRSCAVEGTRAGINHHDRNLVASLWPYRHALGRLSTLSRDRDLSRRLRIEIWPTLDLSQHLDFFRQHETHAVCVASEYGEVTPVLAEREQPAPEVTREDLVDWIAQDMQRLSRLRSRPAGEVLPEEIRMVEATIAQFEAEIAYLDALERQNAAGDVN